MATQVNKKLIVYITVFFGAAILILGGLWFLYARGDASRNIRRGDALMAEGQYEDAAKQYARGVSKEKSNLEYLDKWESSILAISPPTQTEAKARYSELVVIRRSRAIHNPANIAFHRAVIDDAIEAAQWSKNSIESWQNVEDALLTMQDSIGDNLLEEAQLLAELGRAKQYLSPSEFTNVVDMQGNVHFPGEDELRAAVALDPENDLAWASLAQGRLEVVGRLELDGRLRQAEQQFEFAVRTFEDLERVVSGKPRSATALAKFYTIQYIRGISKKAENIDELLAKKNVMIDQMEAVIQQSSDPMLIRTAVSLLQIGGIENAYDRSVKILSDYISRHPDEVTFRYELAKLYYDNSFQDEAALLKAKELANGIVNGPGITSGFNAVVQFPLQKRAASLLFDIALSNLEIKKQENPDADLTDEELKCDEARLTLLNICGGDESDLLILRADGKRASVYGNYRLVAQKLEELWTRAERVDPFVARILVDALDKLGQTGLAYERVLEGLKVKPDNLQLLVRKASLEAKLGRYSQASETLSVVPESLIEEYEDLRSLSNRLEEALESGSSSVGLVSKGLADVYMKIGANDLLSAKNDLLQLRESNPESARVLLASIKVAVMLNDRAFAKEYLQLLKDLEPENASIRAIEVSLEIDDPIEAIVSYLSETNEDPIERDIETVSAIISYMKMEENRINRLIATGYSEVGQEALDHLVAAHLKLEVMIESLAERAPDDFRVVKFCVLVDCEKGEWDLAEKKIELARGANKENTELLHLQANFYQSLGEKLQFEGKLVAGKEKLLKSVESLKLLIKKAPYQSYYWHSLAKTYRALGNNAEANQAFEESYRRNPNDTAVVKDYAKSLIKTPDGTSRAIRIIRQAMLLAPNQVELRELWLQLEAEQGNIPTIMKARVDQYAKNPADITNAANLVRLITLSDPTSEFIQDDDGQPIYNSQSWDRLSNEQQSYLLAGVRDQWNKVARKIIAELDASLGENRAFASLRANLEMSQGDVEVGAQLLKDRISSLGDRVVGDDYVALANFFIEANRFNDAKQAFISAIELNDKYKMFASQQLSNLYISQKQYIDALALLGEEMKETPNPKVHARFIECLIWQDMLEEAAEEITIRDQLYETDFYSQILKAKLHQARSKQYGIAGDMKLANIEYANSMQALESSKKMLPGDSMPYIIEAAGFIDKYEWDEDRLSLDKAIQSLDKADQLANSISTQTSLARVKVLNLLGNQNAADSALRQLVLQFPENIMARDMLVNSLVSQGQVDDAILLIEEGIMLSPNSPYWYGILGSVQQANGNTNKAVISFLQSYELSRNPSSLLVIADITRGSSEWDGSLLVDIFVDTPELIKNSSLGGLLARAILRLGQRDKALELMADAYQKISVDGEDPDFIKRNYAIWFSDLENMYSSSETSAGEDFVRSLPGFEESSQVLEGLALFWIRSYSDNQDRAIELLNIVADSDYEDDQIISALHILGQIYLVTNKLAEASEVYSKILGINDNDGIALNNKAHVLMTYENDLVEAMALSKRVVEMYPEDLNYMDTLASIYRGLGQTTEAIKLLNKVLALDSQNAKALIMMASIYSVDLEEPGQALPFAEQAKRLSPENAKVLDELGWINFQLGNDMEAEELFRKSLKIEELPVTYLHLAHVLALDGRFQGAISRLNRADELTKNPELKAEIATLRADIDEKAAISIP